MLTDYAAHIILISSGKNRYIWENPYYAGEGNKNALMNAIT